MKVVVERFCPHTSPSSKPLVPGRKPSGVVRTGFGAPKKKVVPKDGGRPGGQVGGLAGLVSKERPLYDGKLRNLLQYFRKKIPQQNDRGFWLNFPQMGNHPC